MPLAAEKAAVRRAVLARRDALAPEARARLSRRISERLLELPDFARTRRALAYLSFGSEVDTAAVVAGLQARGCEIALPRVDRAQRRLELYFVADLARDLVPGVWGIREPRPEVCVPASLADIDVVLAPGVAFTARGDRLGYGGGFYDRLLGGSASRPRIVAGAFDLQIVDELPSTRTDIPVDVIVTESRVFNRAG